MMMESPIPGGLMWTAAAREPHAGDTPVSAAGIWPEPAEDLPGACFGRRSDGGDARLCSLELAGDGVELAPAFDPAVREYVVIVPHTTETLSIRPVSAQPDASVRVFGNAIARGAVCPLGLKREFPSFQVEVCAKNGRTLTYTLFVLRQQAGRGG